MKKTHRFALCLLGFLVLGRAAGYSAEFFESEALVSFRLEAPLTELKNQRGDETEELPGKIYYTLDDGSEAALNVKIEARGNFRRQRTICKFPPYWINFKKSEVKGTPFAGLDKVKMVSHCNQGWRTYEPYMYTEYLIYKTFNMLTDFSFGVRLASISYLDTDKEKDEGVYGAFFIEHVDSLEDRLRAKQVKDRFILPSRYNLRQLCLAEMFQFMIGNTDFSFFASEDECCHNAKVFAPIGNSSGLFPVPYDFDMTGLVSAPYAEPNPNFPIRSIQHRLYRGIEVDEEIWAETVTLFFDNREKIEALWANFELIEEKYRTKALKYIAEFYKVFQPGQKSKVPYTGHLRSFELMERLIQEDIENAAAKAEKDSRRSKNR
jgi:hypothetical protein